MTTVLTDADRDAIFEQLGRLDFLASCLDHPTAAKVYKRIDTIKSVLSQARQRQFTSQPTHPQEPFRLRSDR